MSTLKFSITLLSALERAFPDSVCLQF